MATMQWSIRHVLEVFTVINFIQTRTRTQNLVVRPECPKKTTHKHSKLEEIMHSDGQVLGIPT